MRGLVTIPVVGNNKGSDSTIYGDLDQGSQRDTVDFLDIDLPVGSTLRIRGARQIGNVDDSHYVPK